MDDREAKRRNPIKIHRREKHLAAMAILHVTHFVTVTVPITFSIKHDSDTEQ